MQFDMQKLERMSLEELRTAATELGIKVRKAHTPKMLAYAILDAQADQRAAVVEAKEAEKEERRKASGDRKRVRVKASPQLIRTDNLKSATALATVGSEKEEMSQIHEHLKANPHKANRTVQAVEARKPLSDSTETRINDLA